jgi:hypothetical protein
MPVQQLQNDQGLGSIIGAVGGYLAQNPERKAKKAQLDIENKRNAASDARADAQAKDTHDNITNEIATRNATTQQTTADATNAQFQQGAYAKASTMLHNRPQGVPAQQWVAQVQKQVPTLGLTDPKLLGQLYGEAQGVITQDQATNATNFVKHEQVLPSDPNKAIGTLMKRQQIEGGVPGIDPKRTQDMITATNKQITDAQTAAYHAQATAERKRHDVAVENKPQRPDHFGQVTPAQQHQWDIEDKNFDLATKRYNAEFPGGKKPGVTKPPGAGDWTTIKESASIKALSPVTKASLQQGINAYGASGAATHLQNAIKTGKFPPGFDADSAQSALDALNASQ